MSQNKETKKILIEAEKEIIEATTRAIKNIFKELKEATKKEE